MANDRWRGPPASREANNCLNDIDNRGLNVSQGDEFTMKLLTATMKMCDVIHSNYLLIPVVNRFGIRLGFGEKTVKTVCKECGIDVEFFLTIINVFSNENYFPQRRLQTFNVLMIVEYLRKTHSYYIETQVPLIERLIKELIHHSPKSNSSLKLVKKFFLEYKKELLAHLKREESVTFPYVERVYNAYRKHRSGLKSGKQVQYSMQVYEKEHDDVDDKLYDLQNILIKYISGGFDEPLCNAIIFELFRLEQDIKDHTRIEDNILRPVVQEMEESLRAQAA